MSVPDDAARPCGGTSRPRRRPWSALPHASGLIALAALCACDGAEPFYRHANLGGGATGGEGGPASPAPVDARPDRADDPPSSDDQALAEVGGPGGDAEDGGASDGGDTAAGCGVCALGVLYWCEGTSANTIRATFSLANDTPEAIPLREVTIRYWFTGAGGSPWDFACDNGMLGEAPDSTDVTSAVTGAFHAVTPPRPGADMYFEVGFTAAAGNLLPGQPNLFRTRVFRDDYSTITQTDDYSFNPKYTTFAPSAQVTLYRNGMLIEGIEPQTR